MSEENKLIKYKVLKDCKLDGQDLKPGTELELTEADAAEFDEGCLELVVEPTNEVEKKEYVALKDLDFEGNITKKGELILLTAEQAEAFPEGIIQPYDEKKELDNEENEDLEESDGPADMTSLVERICTCGAEIKIRPNVPEFKCECGVKHIR